MADFDPTVDIRPTIAHGRGYNPTAHQHEPTPFKEYGKEIIAQNKAEEDAFLGTVHVKPAPVWVDIAALGQNEPVQVVSKPRGRPKKTVLELPKNLE